MKSRQLIKVVATAIAGVEGGRLESVTARGITLMKKGTQSLNFIHDFLIQRDITHYTLNQRAPDTWVTSPIMLLNREPREVLMFSFHLFQMDDLGFHAKDLTPAELERDMKPLQKLIYKD